MALTGFPALMIWSRQIRKSVLCRDPNYYERKVPNAITATQCSEMPPPSRSPTDTFREVICHQEELMSAPVEHGDQDLDLHRVKVALYAHLLTAKGL
jgi:hypothetical protein